MKAQPEAAEATRGPLRSALRQRLALRRQPLQAVVLGIRDVDIAPRVERHTAGEVERNGVKLGGSGHDARGTRCLCARGRDAPQTAPEERAEQAQQGYQRK